MADTMIIKDKNGKPLTEFYDFLRFERRDLFQALPELKVQVGKSSLLGQGKKPVVKMFIRLEELTSEKMEILEEILELLEAFKIDGNSAYMIVTENE